MRVAPGRHDGGVVVKDVDPAELEHLIDHAVDGLAVGELRGEHRHVETLLAELPRQSLVVGRLPSVQEQRTALLAQRQRHLTAHAAARAGDERPFTRQLPR
jgi:hypothetical protein